VGRHPAAFASSGRRLLLVRVAWIVIVVLALGLFAVSITALYAQRSAPPEPLRAGLVQLGLPIGLYAAYWSAVMVVFAVACIAVAAVIAWRKPDDGMALLVSLFLVLLGVANAPNMQALMEVYPALGFPAQCLLFLTYACLLLFLCLFPNGLFVPRWTRPFALVWLVSIPVTLLLTGDSLGDPGGVWLALIILGGLPIGAVAQIYRYARVSDPLQRQQTKWVVFGISVAIVGQVVFPLLVDFFPSLTRPGSTALLYDLADFTGITLCYLFIPLTIGIAVLRYRLWDIDVLINRALVYGALTASVVGLYVLLVGGLGALLQARGNLPISLVATGLVAVLFAPMRDRLQRGVNRLMYGERDDPYGVLSRLGERLEATLEPESVLPAVAETVAQALKLPYAAITLKEDGEGREGFVVAAAYGSPVSAPIRLPLVYQHETVGQLVLAPRVGEESFSATDRRLLDDLARQAGIAAHAVLLTADLQRARERLVTAREEERRRLRRDLHDGLGPQLSSQALTIDAIRALMRRDPGSAESLLLDMKQQARDAVADIRRLVYALRPPALDDLGLVGALRETAAQYGQNGIDVSVDAQELPPLPAAVEVAAYRIAQEAMTNVARHAEARECSVSLAPDELLDAGVLCLEVRDDGRGLPKVQAGVTSPAPAGVGLHSMRERATELGGSLTVEALPEGGTVVRARLPLPEEE
jgi:signal transduction histidine kinase